MPLAELMTIVLYRDIIVDTLVPHFPCVHILNAFLKQKLLVSYSLQNIHSGSDSCNEHNHLVLAMTACWCIWNNLHLVSLKFIKFSLHYVRLPEMTRAKFCLYYFPISKAFYDLLPYLLEVIKGDSILVSESFLFKSFTSIYQSLD